MTVRIPSTRPHRGAAQALWFAVLALLLSVQSATGGATSAPSVEGAVQALRVATAVPPAMQFRDAGKVVQATSRVQSPKVRGEPHGGDPALPTLWTGLAEPDFSDGLPAWSTRRDDPRVHQSSDRYRARAPPRSG